jgi:predicted secreted protein
MYAVIGFLALIALVVGGIVLFNALAKDKQPSEFAMPDVANQVLEAGSQALVDAGLQLNAPVIEENPAFAEGTITRTDPVAGTTVLRAVVTVFYNPVKTSFASTTWPARRSRKRSTTSTPGPGAQLGHRTENNPDVEAAGHPHRPAAGTWSTKAT